MPAYWEQFQQLLAEGRPFVTVTLVDVIASAPADVGSKMLVTADGLFHGSVGGGKIEMKALAAARDMLASRQSNQFIEWNLQRDVGMTCGGGVRLFLEAYNLARWPIVIFGAGHCAQALVRLLLTLPCHITVIDSRAEWLAKFPTPSTGDAHKLTRIQADKPLPQYVASLPSNAFVLCITMGHATDQPILLEILQTRDGTKAPAFPYVGVIGSAAKAATLKRGLMAAGLTEAQATPTSAEHPVEGARYCCPIGLPIGTNDPNEIAISIAAQLLEVRGTVQSK